MNFALIGAGGHVAPRHLAAIRDTGHRLVSAVDPRASAAVLDQFWLDVGFFTDTASFAHDLARRTGPDRVDVVSICSPNHLHAEHCLLGLRAGADVICEKPLVTETADLDVLERAEADSGQRVYCVLQSRLNRQFESVRQSLDPSTSRTHDVVLTYVIARGSWYDLSWKGRSEQSGGVLLNIGIHVFDLLICLFGEVREVVVHARERRRAGGYLAFERARVRWLISTLADDLPFPVEPGGPLTYRSLAIDGADVDLLDGSGDLHTRAYRQILGGKGVGLAAVRPSLSLVDAIHRAPLSGDDDRTHPKMRNRGSGHSPR